MADETVIVDIVSGGSQFFDTTRAAVSSVSDLTRAVSEVPDVTALVSVDTGTGIASVDNFVSELNRLEDTSASWYDQSYHDRYVSVINTATKSVTALGKSTTTTGSAAKAGDTAMGGLAKSSTAAAKELTGVSTSATKVVESFSGLPQVAEELNAVREVAEELRNTLADVASEAAAASEEVSSVKTPSGGGGGGGAKPANGGGLGAAVVGGAVSGLIGASLAKVPGPIGAITMGFKKATDAASFLTDTVLDFGKKGISAFVDHETVVKKMESVLTASGGVVGYNSRQLQEMADQLQDVTKYSDDVALSAQSILLGFRNIRGDVFRDALSSAADLSTILGGDLTQSALQIGKALNDPVEGLGALSRAGVTFTEAQEEQILAMMRAGDVAAAQQVILDELAKSYGGAATAELDTYAGQWAQVQNRMQEAYESIGEALMPALESLMPLVNDGVAAFAGFTRGLSGFSDEIKGVANGAVALVRGIFDMVLKVVSATMALKAEWDESGFWEFSMDDAAKKTAEQYKSFKKMGQYDRPTLGEDLTPTPSNEYQFDLPPEEEEKPKEEKPKEEKKPKAPRATPAPRSRDLPAKEETFTASVTAIDALKSKIEQSSVETKPMKIEKLDELASTNKDQLSTLDKIATNTADLLNKLPNVAGGGLIA